MAVKRSTLLLGLGAALVNPHEALAHTVLSSAGLTAGEEPSLVPQSPLRKPPAERLLAAWDNSWFQMPGASERDLAAFEAKHDVELPADFREYLLRANGTGDNVDGELFAFWSIERMDGERTDCPRSDTIFKFADHFWDCWMYGIDLGRNSDHSVYVLSWPDGRGGYVDLRVGSFADFVALYVHEDFWAWHVALVNPKGARELNVEPRVRRLSADQLKQRMVNEDRSVLRT